MRRVQGKAMTGSDVFHVLTIGRAMINGGRESDVLVTTGLEFLASVGARAEVSHGDRVRMVPRGSIYPGDRWGTVTGHEVMRVVPDDDGPVEIVNQFGLCESGRWARASELH